MEAPVEVEPEVIDMDDIEEGGKESYLVGKLVTDKNLNLLNLMGAVEKTWKPKYGMRWREWGESKLILFGFDDVMDRDWVLKNQPWHFNGSLFVLKKITWTEQQLSPSVNIIVEHASFYARLYDVPFVCMNEASLGHFAKQIGVLESVDISGEDLFGRFIRFKVSINITKPLLRGINVRVKGKHLWLPLKYESLPIYCFSCGTIGHDHNNCRSYSPNLKYSSLKLRASSSKARRSIEERTLPHDIMENILSRLPVKYLIRYKSVCKLWAATISDPRFAEIHLQRYKNSSSRSLLAWEQLFKDFQGFYVVKVQGLNLQFVSRIQLPMEYKSSGEILCDCDGLYLKSFTDERKKYLLWNPSCRAYKEFCCPQTIEDTGYSETTLYGIYYNPHMKDYKVVIADMKQYAVYSCRYNEWSEVKKMEGIFNRNGAPWVKPVSLNGSFYWLSIIYGEGEFVEFEIIWFDGKVESFKKLPMPDHKKESDFFYLSSSGGHLCLFMINRMSNDKVSIWINVNGDENVSWIEFKLKLHFNPARLRRPANPSPVRWLNEGELMLDVEHSVNYFLYDLRKNSVVELRNSYRFIEDYNPPVLYRENLFLP